MNCTKAQIWLQGYVDGALSPSKAERVRRHVEFCPDCEKALARLSELKTMLAEHRSQVEMDASPEFFWSQVRAEIAGETQPKRNWRVTFGLSWPRVLAWASAAACIAVLAAFVWVQTWPKPAQVVAIQPTQPAPAQVDRITTSGPGLYAESYHSEQSRATIIWTEGMPVISLEL